MFYNNNYGFFKIFKGFLKIKLNHFKTFKLIKKITLETAVTYKSLHIESFWFGCSMVAERIYFFSTYVYTFASLVQIGL